MDNYNNNSKPLNSPMKAAFNLITTATSNNNEPNNANNTAGSYDFNNSMNNNFSIAMLNELENLRLLCIKRLATFVHFHRALESKTFYLNTILLTKQDILNLYNSNNKTSIQKLIKRSKQYYYLGYNISTVLDISNLVDFSKSLMQIMIQFENLYATESNLSNTFKKKIFSRRKTEEYNPTSILSISNNLNNNDYNAMMDNLALFEKTSNTSTNTVFFSLCSILSIVYDKMRFEIVEIINNHTNNSSNKSMGLNINNFVDNVNKIDVKVKKIIVTVTKELDTVVQECIKRELEYIDPLFIMKKQQAKEQ